MDKKLVVSVFFLFLLVAGIIGNVAAQTETVALGVSVGNNFKYDLKYFWNSSLPGQIPPLYLVEENQTDYFQLTVQMAAGATAVLQTSWRFLNGTVVNGTELADVSGTNENITSSLFLYAANLTANGKLFPMAPDLPWVINSTSFRDYQGNIRETLYIEVNRTDLQGQVYSHLSLYFDKLTGILIESTSTDVYTATPNQIFTRHLALKESNVWVVPEFPALVAVPLLMVTTVAAALLFKRRHVS